MDPFLAIGELTTGQRDRFAVMAIDPTVRIGNGCSAIVQSLHRTRAEAELAKTALQTGGAHVRG